MKKTVSIILLLCLMLSMTACGSKAPELTKTNKIMPVYYTVKKGDISSVNVCTGSVMPELTEIYFGTDGNVDKINFRLGDKVKAGDEIYVMNSELDINAGKPTEQNFQSQKNKYKQVMKLMLRFKDQTEAVQVWGVIDTMSWRRDGYPLLFDKNMNPKPAFFGVAEAAQEDQ